MQDYPRVAAQFLFAGLLFNPGAQAREPDAVGLDVIDGLI